ncbi:stage V sporulation protein AD [Peribacillus sp. SCS-37]|uniref:stage V sporulation protein AD n=1 Tax=Paraperibacillus esterisolvens TaxID=3115296 RepID=UPI003905A85E
MLTGKHTWTFSNHPVILSTGVAGGPFEANGRLAEDFDLLHDDLWMGKESYEQAHQFLLEEAVSKALEKQQLSKEDIQFFLAGDLVNQITPSSFAASANGIPYIGLFGACSTSMEGLAISAFLVNYSGAEYIITGASSHNAAVEKQFRYPTEYGGQKPPTAQWTVTGAGAALIGKNNNEGGQPCITSATIGKVVDMGLSDPFNMGGAMAPAASDTILKHLADLNVGPDHYDLIITGDLGKIGRKTALMLLQKNGVELNPEKFLDCGLLIYKDDQEVFSGASGPGCSASVFYGHILRRMKEGEFKRVLVVATGALLSPLTVQQKQSIPCIAHAVAVEMI